MARKQRPTPTVNSKTDFVPKHLSKQEFARRLYRLMTEKGWRQSELGRRAGLPRDSISTYMRAKTLPTKESVKKLAKALGVEPLDILPNFVESAIDADMPMMEMKVSNNMPSKAWLRVNQLVPTSVASEIIAILQKHAGGNDNGAAT